ncbi:high mobility group B protein 15-like [Solanum dulcamara]|uniref:high mobility group B protein 15-like n=1 Tax=Solanum dulcamara TaxID=45834 RepID=UPI002486A353|nr:high mobility group B protein 15-like [Solanum dulcamara]XP_055813874.1 high mobility group B protein 15-like [Solanum dulcamara]XP_055813875.1 high mobility group B protein 15-like [Solanum dulcamara]XP_055813876.1 high mobility group B protein 15-like [Solanum dulcamara]XP_055813877.1 high mobility group B protein 15-like [Solanum dulcamara]XP_055813878.1 high mobility group B protein 15-like [Solanum dulcamara]XP_055813879.1 high mobility group B protein 15-like [Solanum dulcamara]XP_0
MTSSSAENSPVPLRVAPPNYHPYPSPLVTYENVVASPQLFMDTLQKLHAAMRTKFMIPVIGGKALDLHRLFVEVTTRGGISKVLGEKRWKEVTLVFSFPSSATNASFILRKYYISLLFHYERVYYFKAKYWTPSPDVLQQASRTAAPPQGLAGYVLPPPEIEAALPQPQRIETTFPEETTALSTGSPVSGYIDGKFESGYLITVKIGSEDFKGVLYQIPMSQMRQELQNQNLPVYNTGKEASPTGVVRRKRRKKYEIKKRDPAHPKPNRSGYNFFFAEQHARLKPLYPGKDREISRMIGELWNNLNVPEKMVYQEKALQDKERYRLEMQDYRERLTTGQIISSPLPIQSPLEHNADMIDQQSELQSENGNISWSPEHGASSDKCAQSNSENNNKGTDPPVLEMKANNVILEEFELLKRVDMVECEDKEMQEEEEEDDEADKQEELQQSKEKVFFFLEEKTLLPTEEKI